MKKPAGRPRVAGESPTGLGTRQDILHASAILFCTVGYGGTSTHAIAAAAGIRQASVYHYFAGKHEILLTLLLGTVAPSVEAARTLLARTETASARLWALCASDAGLLAGGEVNLGSLYLLPELEDERFGELHALRAELQAAYSELIAACDTDIAGAAATRAPTTPLAADSARHSAGHSAADSAGQSSADSAGHSAADSAGRTAGQSAADSGGQSAADSAAQTATRSAADSSTQSAGLVLSLVESVILQRRRDPRSLDDGTAGRIADAALKVIDLPAAARIDARDRGAALLADLG